MIKEELDKYLDIRKIDTVLTDYLWRNLPKEQVEEIMSSGGSAELDRTFLGFISVYAFLAVSIPTHWTIIDFGCAYASQAYFFRNHKNYIGVDISNHKRFKFNNGIYYNGGIDNFLKYEADKYSGDIFAICNYVPCDEEFKKKISQRYVNNFIYYPSNTEIESLIDGLDGGLHEILLANQK